MAGPRWEDSSPIEEDRKESKDKGSKGKAPSWEDSSPINEHESLNPLQSAGIGAVQGATFGFGDEGLAALKSLATTPGKAQDRLAASGDFSPSNVLKTYGNTAKDEYTGTRDQLRQLVADAKEQNPKSFLTGEFGGGFLAPGVGLAGKAYKATAAFSPLARIASRVGLGLASGGIVGGLAGAGNSEGSTPQAIASDAGRGAIGGAAVGGAIPAVVGPLGEVAGYAGNKLNDLVSDVRPLRLLTRPFAKGLQGTDLSQKVQDEASGDFAENLGKDFVNLKKDLSDKYRQFIHDAESNGGSVDLAEASKKIMDDAQEMIPTATPNEQSAIQQIVNHVNQYVRQPTTKTVTKSVPVAAENNVASTGGLMPGPEAPPPMQVNEQVEVPGQTSISPSKAKELETKLGEAKMTQGRLGVGQFANQADKTISGAIADQVPGIAETNKDYTGMSNALDALGIKKGNRTIQYGDEQGLPTSTYSKLLGLVRNQATEGTSAGQKAKYQLENAASALDDVHPELADKIRTLLPEVSENYNLARDLNSPSLTVGHGPIGLIGGLAKGGGKIGNIAGLALNKNGDSISQGLGTGTLSAIAATTQPKQLSQDVYSLNKDSLSGLANHLHTTPQFSAQGEALQAALDSKNEVSKNAVLFNLLQQKSGRDILKSYTQQ